MSKLLSDVDPALAVHAVAFDNLTVPSTTLPCLSSSTVLATKLVSSDVLGTARRGSF